MLLHAKHITLWLLFALMCTSCTGVHDLREARSTVATADSLRAAGGALYNDSTALAFAVTTLEPVRLLFPTDYAHANYYYGRLLREAGDQPEAMLAFLRAVHSRTKNHEIKARSWSNMGTMSHAAGEFALSYDMYEKSAECFLKGKDTIMHYFAKNAMAVELAELSMHDEALVLIDDIIQECSYWPVIAKAYEAQAILYFNIEQYDSVLYSVDRLQAYGNHEPTGYVKKAQAFWFLANYDSALVYAKHVMEMPAATPRDQYNMLYILTYYDSTIDKEQVQQLSEERGDIDKYVIDPWLTQLTKATDLLKYNLDQKPDLRWLYAVFVTLLLISMGIATYVTRKKRKHQLLSQQVEDLQHKQDVLSEQNLQLEQQYTLRQEKAMKEMEEFCHSITADNIKEKLSWKNFDQMCNIVNQRMFGLVDKLKSRGITSEPELRLCVLVAVGRFNNKEMVSLVPYGYDSLKTTKSTLANRLGVSGRKMRDFLLHLAL